MKKDVLIKIKGIQTIEGEQNVTELFTQGNLYKKNSSYYITYDETETTGYEGCKTTLKVDGNNKVVMMRSGNMRSHLVAELGRRNIGYYETLAGEMQIGTYTKTIKSSLTDDGGDVYCSYNLEVNSNQVSENEIYINVSDERKEFLNDKSN